jgi:hypothetical protein
MRLSYPKAEHHVAYVGSHLLAQAGDGIDVTQLGGQEGIGGVLDRLRRGGIGDDEGRTGGGEQAAHQSGGLRVVGPDHEPVGVQAVAHRRALA